VHVTPLLTDLYWLSTLRVTSGSALVDSITQPYALFFKPLSSSKKLPSGISIPAHKTISVHTVLVCGSMMVEQATECHQSRGVPLYLQESLQDFSSENTSSPNTSNTLTCLTSTYYALLYLISLHLLHKCCTQCLHQGLLLL